MRRTAISLLTAALLTFGGGAVVLAVDPTPGPTGTGDTEPARDEGFPLGLLGLLGLAGLAGLKPRERPAPVVVERQPPNPGVRD
jgi:hypothetical protein